jgi:hypothetical protein
MATDLNVSRVRQGATAILVLVFGLQLVGLWWWLSQLMFWIHDDTSEGILPYFLVPFLLCWVLMPLVGKNTPVRPLLHRIARIVLPIGLFLEAVVGWLIYANLSRFPLFPEPAYPGEGSLLAGWLSTDLTPLYLAVVWAWAAFFLIIPAVIGLWRQRGELPAAIEERSSTRGWHWGVLVLSVFLAIRWGGIHSQMLLLATVVLLLVPWCIAVLPKDCNTSQSDPSIPLRSYPLLPGLAMLFILAFWFFVIEIQLQNRLGTTYLWGIPAAGHAILLIIFRKPTSQVRQKPFLGLWICLEIVTIGMCSINLALFLFNLRYLWLVAGSLCGALGPELYLAFRGTIKKATVPRIWLIGLVFFMGLLFPYLPNAYDPLSSYIAIGLCVVNVPFTIPYIIKSQGQ